MYGSAEHADPLWSDGASRQLDDVHAGTVGGVVTRVNARERGGNRPRIAVAAVEPGNERLHAILVAKRGQRIDDRRSQQFLIEQTNQGRHDAGIVDASERVDRRERQEEVARLGDAGERLDRLRRPHPPERFDGMKADVGVVVLERRDQRRDRRRVGERSERERGVHTQVGRRIAEQLHERRGHIPVGGDQHLQRAAEDVQIVMVALQRLEQVRELVACRRLPKRANRRAAQPPVVGADGGNHLH